MALYNMMIMIIIILTPVLNSQGIEKLRYAIQKIQKSNWNEPYSSFQFYYYYYYYYFYFKPSSTKPQAEKLLLSLLLLKTCSQLTN